MDSSYIMVDYNMAPDVFKRVIMTKKLIDSGKYRSVNEALIQTKLSRTAFHKYKNHIFSCSDNISDNIATLAFTLDDVTGILSEILSVFAKKEISVLTINQNIPVNGVANMTISLRLKYNSEGMEKIMSDLKKINGVNKVDLLAMA